MKSAITFTIGLFLWLTAFYIQLNNKHEALEKHLNSEIQRLEQLNDTLEKQFIMLHKDVAKYVIMDSEGRRIMKANEIFQKVYFKRNLETKKD